MNKKISIFLFSLFCVALMTACGSKKDSCPSMGLDTNNTPTEITA